MVEGGGFEPPKLARQIYSLIPLATREPLREKPGIIVHCQAAVKPSGLLPRNPAALELARGVEPPTC